MNIDKQHLFDLVKQINHKKELLKAVIETSDDIQRMVDNVKEAQEALKSMIEADEEAFALQQEIKDLTKELSQASKTIGKALALQGIEAKSAHIKAFASKKVKDEEAVEKVIQTGSKFNVLKGVL